LFSELHQNNKFFQELARASKWPMY
jgi:hypothetical protein